MVVRSQSPVADLTATALSKTSVRIVSAYPRYEGLCIQDSTDEANTTGYQWIVSAYKSGNALQAWLLESTGTADSTAFYLRNAETGRYISSETKYHKAKLGIMYLPESSTKGSVWNFTRLSNGQYVVSTADSYGLRRYLAPCDTLRIPSPFGGMNNAGNSAFVWNLYNSSDDLTGLKAVDAEKTVGVGQIDGHILVSGTDSYRIYDASGRTVAAERRLPKGVYIVVAGKEAHKVSIK